MSASAPRLTGSPNRSSTVSIDVVACIAGDAAEVAAWEARLSGVDMTWIMERKQ